MAPMVGKVLLSDYRRKGGSGFMEWATQLLSCIFILTSHFHLRGSSLLAKGGLVASLVHLINSS